LGGENFQNRLFFRFCFFHTFFLPLVLRQKFCRRKGGAFVKVFNQTWPSPYTSVVGVDACFSQALKNASDAGLPDGLFLDQKSQFGYILDGLGMEMLAYFTAFWYN
jgi:hypothetical protein